MQTNYYYLLFERIGGVDELENLQNHKNSDIY